ncbi:MAG: hypothetical protein ACI9X4_001524 [Glaciecola sp.]|jgi:hypothetical protein
MCEFPISQDISKQESSQKQVAGVLGKRPEDLVFNVFTYELEVAAPDEKKPVAVSLK